MTSFIDEKFFRALLPKLTAQEIVDIKIGVYSINHQLRCMIQITTNSSPPSDIQTTTNNSPPSDIHITTNNSPPSDIKLTTNSSPPGDIQITTNYRSPTQQSDTKQGDIPLTLWCRLPQPTSSVSKYSGRDNPQSQSMTHHGCSVDDKDF